VRSGNPLWVFPIILLDGIDGAVARRQRDPHPGLSRFGEFLDSTIDFACTIAFCYAVRPLAHLAPLLIFCAAALGRLAGFVYCPRFFSGVLIDSDSGVRKTVYYGVSVPMATAALAIYACLIAPGVASGAPFGPEYNRRLFPAGLDVPLLLCSGLLYCRVLIFHKFWVRPPQPKP